MGIELIIDLANMFVITWGWGVPAKKFQNNPFMAKYDIGQPEQHQTCAFQQHLSMLLLWLNITAGGSWTVTIIWSGFSHAPWWAREECAGMKTGTPIYSFKSIPLITRRDTHSLLSLPNFSSLPSPHQPKPLEMQIAQQPLSTSAASWQPVGHLAWSPRCLPGSGPW